MTAEQHNFRVTPGSTRPWVFQYGETFTQAAICPDRLRMEQMGEADNARGRFVLRAIRLLDRLWPVRD